MQLPAEQNPATSIKKYIEHWRNVENQKPVNDKEFVLSFTKFILNLDHQNFEFEGDNDYCGCTAIVHEIEPRFNFGKTESITLELAYGSDFVKVFRADHNDFWTPEYISLSGKDAQEIISILKDKLLSWGGF